MLLYLKMMIRVNSVQCTKKHESKDFIGCSTSFMILMVKIMKMLMLRVLFGAYKIWFLPGCEAWCWVVLVPPGHPLHWSLCSVTSQITHQKSPGHPLQCSWFCMGIIFGIETWYLATSSCWSSLRPEVSLCLGVGQTYPGVKGVKHKVRLEKWGKSNLQKETNPKI